MDSSQSKGSNIAQMIWIVGSPIIFTVGVFGNLMTIIVLTNKRNKTSSTTIFLTFIALADLLVMTVMLPRWWLIYMFGFDVRHIHNLVCKVQFFANYFCGSYSAFLLAAVTVERTICTVKPYKIKEICTVQIATIISIALALTLTAIHGHVLFGIRLFEVAYNVTSEAGTISPLPNASNWSTNTCEFTIDRNFDTESNTSDDLRFEDCTSFFNSSIEKLQDDLFFRIGPNKKFNGINKIKVCWYDDPRYGHFFSEIHQIVGSVTFLFIPETIFLVGGIIIVKVLRQSRKLRMRMRSEYMQTSGNKPAFDSRATQITLTLLLVNIVFVFTTTPALIYLMGRHNWVDEDTGMTEIQEIIWAVVNLMIYINHAINFILFFLSGHRFRRQVLETFGCLKNPSGERFIGAQVNQLGTISMSTSFDINLK